MSMNRTSFVGFAILALALPTLASAQGNASPDRWESAIQAFEAADRESPPLPGGVVFVGSSSIRFWSTLAEDFPTLQPLNRGFGGSRISDVLHFVDRLVLAYRPRLVVLYAGDNDLAAGRTAQQVFDDYHAIVRRVREELPNTRIAFISIKPSPRRWDIVDAMRLANARVASVASRDSLLDYIDVFTPMLGADGMPRPELYVEDRLHMTPEGYAVWKSVVEPFVVGRPSARAQDVGAPWSTRVRATPAARPAA